MKNLPPESLQKKIWSYLDGELSEAEEQEFQSLLKEDPVARRFYLRSTAMQSVLHWEHSSMEEEPAVVRAKKLQSVPVAPIPIWGWIEKSGIIPLGIAAAFIGVFALLGVHFLKQEDRHMEEIVMEEPAPAEEPAGWISQGNGASFVFVGKVNPDAENGFYQPTKHSGGTGQSLVFHFENPASNGGEG